ncbi:MAG TPA: hypothetical protein VHE77_18480 [Dongiaceae bacterium]|jgi:hypothetical protein|nr:hypothetical protein [Dongiaceae bacterium]
MTTKRIIGLVLLAAAIMFGLADLWQTYFPSYGSADLTVGRLWVLVSARSLGIAEDLIQRHLWSPIWDFAISPILVTPAWTFFGVLGGIFIVFGRPNVVER